MAMKIQVFLLVSVLAIFETIASPTLMPPSNSLSEEETQASQIVKRALAKGCSHSYTLSCLKLDVVSLVERLARQDSYQLMPSIAVVRQNATPEEMESSRAYSSSETSDSVMAAMARDGPDAAESRLDGLLLDRVSRYLDTHAISVRLVDEALLTKLRQVGQEAAAKYGLFAAHSGRGKDKKGYGALLMGLMMMKATLGALGFGAIAALAGKALLVGLLSMMLSAIVGLKSLTSGGGGKAVTYEIVSRPVYSHSHSHSSEHSDHGGGGSSYGGYGHGRSMESTQVEAHEQAYSGHL